MNYNPSWGGNHGGSHRSRSRGRGWRGNSRGSHHGNPHVFRGGPPGMHGHHGNFRGGGYRGAPADNFKQSYPSSVNLNEPSWPQLRNRPLFSTLPNFSPGPLLRRPFLSPPRLQSPVRPTSPLPGSEEYMQRDISEKSAFLKRELDLEGANANYVIDSSKFENFADDFVNDSSCSNFCINPHKQSKDFSLRQTENLETENKEKMQSPRRNKRQVQRPTQERMLSVEEIHDRIMNHIASLSLGKKMNLVNQARTTGYDIAIQQITRQKRLELSKALRDMCNDKFKETQNSSDVINAIIPDFDIKIEELPRELVAQLSSTLNEDVQERIQNMCVNPELLFQQAADMLNTSLDGDLKTSDNINENKLDTFDYSQFPSEGDCGDIGSDSNMSQTVKEPVTHFAASGNQPYHNSFDMPFSETTNSSSTMNFPIQCQSSPLDFATFRPVNFGSIPSLMNFAIPPLTVAYQQQNVELNSSAGIRYYSPGQESSNSNSFQAIPIFNKSIAGQNALSNEVPKLTQNMPEAGGASNISRGQESNQYFEVKADVNDMLLPPGKPPFGVTPEKENLIESTIEPSKQIQSKENKAVILSDLCLPLLPVTFKTGNCDKTTDVLTEAAELEACLAQSDSELKLWDDLDKSKIGFTLNKSSSFLNLKTNILTKISRATPKPVQPVKKLKLRRSPLIKLTDDKKTESVTSKPQVDILRKNESLKKKSKGPKTIEASKKPIKLIRSFDSRTVCTPPPQQEKTTLEGKEGEVTKQQQTRERSKDKEVNTASLTHEESINTNSEKCLQKGNNSKEKQLSETSVPESIATNAKADQMNKTKDKFLKCHNNTKSRSRSLENKTVSPVRTENKKSGSKERLKQKSYEDDAAGKKKSKTKYVDQELSKSELYDMSKSERSRYDIFQAQRYEEEYQSKYKERHEVNEEQHRPFTRERSFENFREVFRSSDSDQSEKHRYSKYQSEREDIRHSKRHYHEKTAYAYRSEYHDFKKDYSSNSQKYAYPSEYHSRPESSYQPEEYEQKSSHHNHKSKHGRVHRKRSKKHKRHRETSFSSSCSSDRESTSSNHRKSRHRTKHSDLLDSSERRTPTMNLKKPLKERIQMLHESKHMSRRRYSSSSDYDENRKIKSEPGSPELSKASSSERAKSMERFSIEKIPIEPMAIGHGQAKLFNSEVSKAKLSSVPQKTKRPATPIIPFTNKPCPTSIQTENLEKEREKLVKTKRPESPVVPFTNKPWPTSLHIDNHEKERDKTVKIKHSATPVIPFTNKPCPTSNQTENFEKEKEKIIKINHPATPVIPFTNKPCPTSKQTEHSEKESEKLMVTGTPVVPFTNKPCPTSLHSENPEKEKEKIKISHPVTPVIPFTNKPCPTSTQTENSEKQREKLMETKHPVTPVVPFTNKPCPTSLHIEHSEKEKETNKIIHTTTPPIPFTNKPCPIGIQPENLEKKRINIIQTNRSPTPVVPFTNKPCPTSVKSENLEKESGKIMNTEKISFRTMPETSNKKVSVQEELQPERDQQVQPTEKLPNIDSISKIISNLSTIVQTNEKPEGQIEGPKEKCRFRDGSSNELKTLSQAELDLRKCSQRPWKSPGEKKFMMEQLSRNPTPDEEAVNYEACDHDATLSDQIDASISDFTDETNQNIKVLDAAADEKLKFLNPEPDMIKAKPDTLHEGKTSMESDVSKSSSVTFMDTNKSTVSKDPELKMTNTEQTDKNFEPYNAAIHDEVQKENALAAKTQKNINKSDSIEKLEVAENDLKLLVDTGSVEINSTSEKSKSIKTETKSAEFAVDSNISDRGCEDIKFELISAVESTSSVTEHQASVKKPSSKSRAHFKVQKTKTKSRDSAKTKTTDNKNSQTKSKSSISSKEAEILHSAEVSSTSDTTKLAAHSKVFQRSQSRSRSPPLVINETNLNKNEDLTKPTEETDGKPINSSDINVKKASMLVTTYTQTELESIEHKKTYHKKSKNDTRRDRKHSSPPKSDHLKSKSNSHMQTSIANTGNFTQTSSAKNKCIQVQLEVTENKSTSKKSIGLQTDPIVIIDTTVDFEPLDKSEGADKSTRKILKAVRRKKAIQQMFQLDKEIERLTKLRQKLYKQLNVDSDSDENVTKSSHDHDTTVKEDKHRKHKDKSNSIKKSKIDEGTKSSVTSKKREVKSSVDTNQSHHSTDGKNTKLRASKRSRQSCNVEISRPSSRSSSTHKNDTDLHNFAKKQQRVEVINEEKIKSSNLEKGSSDKYVNKSPINSELELLKKEKCEYVLKVNIFSNSTIKESNVKKGTKSLLKNEQNISQEQDLSSSETEITDKPTTTKYKLTPLETKRRPRRNATEDKPERSSGRDTSSEQTPVCEHIKTKNSHHKIGMNKKGKDLSERETSTEPTLEYRTQQKTNKKQARKPDLDRSSIEKDSEIEESKGSKSKKTSHRMKPSKRSDRKKYKIKSKSKASDIDQTEEEHTRKSVETESPPIKLRKKTPSESSNMSSEESKQVIRTESTTNMETVTKPKLRKKEKKHDEEDVENEGGRSKSSSHTGRDFKELEVIDIPENESSKVDVPMGGNERDAQESDEEDNMPLLGFKKHGKIQTTNLSSEDFEPNEMANNLNGNRNGFIPEQAQFQKPKKRKMTDVIKLGLNIDSQNVLPIHSTKKPKLMSETYSETDNNTQKKKPKRYPFSGINSNYKSKKRKMSSDSNKRKSSTEEKLANPDFSTSVVNITRYSLEQLEKMRESIRNNCIGVTKDSECMKSVSAIQSKDHSALEFDNLQDKDDSKCLVAGNDRKPEPSPVSCVFPMEDYKSEAIKEEILPIKNVEVVPKYKINDCVPSMPLKMNYEASEGLVEDNVDESKEIVEQVPESQPNSVQSEELNEAKIAESFEILDEEDEYRMDFKGFNGAILVIKVIASTALAASDKGKVFCFNMLNGNLVTTFDMSNLAITSMVIIKRSESNIVYTGSLSSCIGVLNFDTKEILKHEKVVEPIQCMENAWNYIFIGSDRGSLIRFDLTTEKVADVIKISDYNVLMMKATQEGPRKVLIIATRNAPVSIRDASSGLLLRTMETPFSPTVYTLLFDKNLIYCGTSQHDILVYTFEDGQLIFKHEATKSKGVVCMQLVGNLLFAGCYNGNIYVYNTKTNVHLGTMNGPGGLMLSMEIVHSKIIVGTKSSNFRAWRIPQNYLDQI